MGTLVEALGYTNSQLPSQYKYISKKKKNLSLQLGNYPVNISLILKRKKKELDGSI